MLLKCTLTALNIASAILASIFPLGYGIFFAFLGYIPCSLLSALTIICAMKLSIESTKPRSIKSAHTLIPFAFILALAITGQIHHFQDTGTSGPCPFEWLNRYAYTALPLLISVAIHKTLSARTQHNQSLERTAIAAVRPTSS